MSSPLLLLDEITVTSLFFSTGTEIVINAGRKQCKAHLQSLKVHFADNLIKVRQNLATTKLNQEESASNLNELLTSLIMSIVEKIKGILQDLLVSCVHVTFPRTRRN